VRPTGAPGRIRTFDLALRIGAQALAPEVDQMSRRNFEDEADRIVVALQRDLILPMDF
jgi:hypothetical protein